ncbi:MAG: PIG-L family deacetylase, partial [Sphaerochaetaceae bacterium]|nr:PIG-L family deacetylase [Sphaerochaetaceae bacterium]
CSLTNGNLGHNQLSKEELERTRLIEGARASSVIGAHYTCLGYDDMTLDSSDSAQIEKLTDLIRSVQPELIITHGEGDAHPDHTAANELVLKCTMLSALRNYKTDSDPLSGVIPVFYMEGAEAREMHPDIYVDVTASFENKIRALGEHSSQQNLIHDDTARDFIHYIEVLGGYRGWQCNVRMAEAFRYCDRRARPTRRYLP